MSNFFLPAAGVPEKKQQSKDAQKVSRLLAHMLRPLGLADLTIDR